MVKRQKEKQYQSAREHRINSQLRHNRPTNSAGNTVRPLPFDCCALTLTPYSNPVCTPDGIIFENSAIMSHLLTHHTNPVNGLKMTSQDVISLRIHKEDNQWCCPILNKPFTRYSKIVAIRQSPPGNEANVYSYEAVEELNFKNKNYEDLISGKKFKKNKKYVIMLVDPNDDELNSRRDINNFVHLASVRGEHEKKQKGMGGSGDVRHSITAQRIMDKLSTQKKKKEQQQQQDQTRNSASSDFSDTNHKKLKVFTTDDVTGVQMTSGKCSGSLTSTAVSVSHNNDSRAATDDEITAAKYVALKKLKKKGYAKIRTNLGDLNVELHCDIVPKTCDNFIGLAEANKYQDSVFHRSIKNFMIQGGKPSKDKAGGEGESVWGGSFEDEFDDRLVHEERGVLSMANAGPGTNRSQFFITFKSCVHLNRKHSVFGRVVGEFQTLDLMEQTPTDKRDKPKQPIQILDIDIVVNPIQEATQKEQERIQQRERDRVNTQKQRRANALGQTVKSNNSDGNTTNDKLNKEEEEERKGAVCNIGKYLPNHILQSAALPMEDSSSTTKLGQKRKKKGHDSKKQDMEDLVIQTIPSRLPPPPKKTTFADFSGW